jgi:DNA-binding PadR family transcriptional regulator
MIKTLLDNNHKIFLTGKNYKIILQGLEKLKVNETEKSLRDLPSELQRAVLTLLEISGKNGLSLQETQQKLNVVHKKCGLKPVSERTLPTIFKRLISKNLAQGCWRYDDDKAKRYYIITNNGLEMLDFLDKLKEAWVKRVRIK